MNFFGEIEILLDVPPVVLIRAGADSQLFRLPRAGFWDRYDLGYGGEGKIMRTLAMRLRNMEG